MNTATSWGQSSAETSGVLKLRTRLRKARVAGGSVRLEPGPKDLSFYGPNEQGFKWNDRTPIYELYMT